MTTHVTAQLEQAIQTLVDDGKKPTVALVKTRMTQVVPIPLIIHALQHWKTTGKIPKTEIIEKPNDPLEKILALEEEIRHLKERLTAIEKQLRPKKLT